MSHDKVLANGKTQEELRLLEGTSQPELGSSTW
jgi:hypothetical protein